MKRIVFPTVLAVLALSAASPVFAKTDCMKDIREFDAAVTKTTASKAEVGRAMKLREEAKLDCAAGGSKAGDADMRQALKLVHAK